MTSAEMPRTIQTQTPKRSADPSWTRALRGIPGLRPVARRALNSWRSLAELRGRPTLPAQFGGRRVEIPLAFWSGPRCNHEPYMAEQLTELLGAGAVFWDVGAHHGLWSSLAASLVDLSGHVVSFEPSHAHDVLARVMQGRSNVALRRQAIGGEVGEVTFFGQGESQTGSLNRDVTAINEHNSESEVSSYLVQVTTLDTVLSEESGDPDLIKIDVEGMELHALRGAKTLLETVRPKLIIEIHPPQMECCGTRDTELLDELHACGYEVAVIDRNPNSIYTILATPR